MRPFSLATTAALTIQAAALGQCPAPRYLSPPQRYTATSYARPAATQPAPAPSPQLTTPVFYRPATQAGGNFLNLINGYRAARGLPALAWDNDLASAAARNNAAGGGHRVSVGAYQIAVPTADVGLAFRTWQGSYTHNSYMLRRDVTRVGAAFSNGTATANLR